MEMDWAFFSRMILDRRYTISMNIATPNTRKSTIILPMDCFNCREVLVISSTVMVVATYRSSMSVISWLEK